MHVNNNIIKNFSYETIIAMCLYTIMITSIIAGQNAVKIFNHTITTGMLIFPLTYILVATSTELYGVKKTRIIILCASFGNLFMGGMIFLFTKLPISSSFIGNVQLYHQFSHRLSYFLFISTFAFVVSESANVWVISRLRLITGGKKLLLRAFLSTSSAVIIDSWILFPLSISFIKNAKLSQAIVETFLIMLIKIGYDMLLLPVFWVVVAIIKQKEGIGILSDCAVPFSSITYLNQNKAVIKE